MPRWGSNCHHPVRVDRDGSTVPRHASIELDDRSMMEGDRPPTTWQQEEPAQWGPAQRTQQHTDPCRLGLGGWGGVVSADDEPIDVHVAQHGGLGSELCSTQCCRDPNPGAIRPAKAVGGVFCSNETLNATAAANSPHYAPTPCGNDYMCYLFDVKNDPTESNNLATANPELLASMLSALASYQKTNVPCCSCTLQPDAVEHLS